MNRESVTPRTWAGDRGRISDAAHVHIVNGDLGMALRVFRKQVERAQITRELKDRATYLPPSGRRRLKSLRARQRARKAAASRTRKAPEPERE